MLLSILSDMLDGREPDLREVALARSVLLRHLDLYEPLNTGGHIRAATDLDVSARTGVGNRGLRRPGPAGLGFRGSAGQ